jgi:hypothetical protein
MRPALRTCNGPTLLTALLKLQMMDRLGESAKLETPEDTTITTFFVGSITPSMSEDEIVEPFLPFGEVWFSVNLPIASTASYAMLGALLSCLTASCPGDAKHGD